MIWTVKRSNHPAPHSTIAGARLPMRRLIRSRT
jgi:hypothetical protein